MRVDRRTFLVGLAAAVPAAAAGVLWSRRDDEEPRADTFAGRATSFVDDLDAARRLGRTYLADNPEEAGERRLRSLLLEASGAWGRADAAVAPETLRTLAMRQARRDYAAGRVVSVGGWYLSRTEARLAALALYA